MKKILISFMVLAAFFAIIGCDTMMSPAGEAYLTVRVWNSVSRAIGPDNYDNASIDHYVISATNGPGEEVSVDTSFESADMVLEPGDWTITVDAYNVDGVVIGSGSTVATLISGSNTVAITVNPIEGEGTATITLNYSGITVDALDFIFTSRSNATVEYTYSASLIGATSTTVSVSLPADTYTLHIQITHDGDTRTLGITEEGTNFLVDYVIRANLTTVDHEPEYHATAGFSVTNNLDPVEYPRVAWTNQPDQGGTISRSVASAPSTSSFFDWKGLDFAATYGAETGTFGITDSSLATLINFNTGLLSGSVSFFSGHTMEVDMLWHDTDGNYYEETYTMSIDPVNGWGVVIDGVNTPNIVDAGMMDYEIAFKEIRFIADDSTTYHIWTNPSL